MIIISMFRTICNFCAKHSSGIFKAPKRFCYSEGLRMAGWNRVADLEELRIVWIDLEMTGLDPQKDHILELACVITDSNLMVLDTHQHVIHHSEEILDNMSDWCKTHHGQSGLIEEVRKSKSTLAEAETRTLDFIKEYTLPQCSPLAGNTVYMDKFFLMKHMPRIVDHLHYRIIDVSTVKEICRRWNPSVARQGANMKKGEHRAMADILDSIKELELYKERFFFCKANDVYKTTV